MDIVAQLVLRSLLTPEVRCSNPVIGKLLYIEHLFTINCLENENKEKETGNRRFNFFCLTKVDQVIELNYCLHAEVFKSTVMKKFL